MSARAVTIHEGGELQRRSIRDPAPDHGRAGGAPCRPRERQDRPRGDRPPGHGGDRPGPAPRLRAGRDDALRIPGFAAPHRLRQDHLAALHRGPHDRSAGDRSGRSRARNRHRARLSGGAAGGACGRGLHGRADRGARRERPPGGWASRATATSSSASATAASAGPTMRPSTASSRPRPPTSSPGRCCSSSSPAGAW